MGWSDGIAEPRTEGRWARPAGHALSESHTHTAWPTRDGTLWRDQSKPLTHDRGDSRTFASYGDYAQGRGLKELQVAPRSPLPRSPSRTSTPRRSASPRGRWHDVDGRAHYYGHSAGVPMSSPSYDAAPARLSSPRRRPSSPRRNTPPHWQQPPPTPRYCSGELEVLVGLPHWLPHGASNVFVSAECDDGAHAASERLHGGGAVGGAWDESGLGGALVLGVRRATSVTLHVMAEDTARPWLPPRSLGGTTIMLPESLGGGDDAARSRLQLVAPLDISIELAFTPHGATGAGARGYERPYAGRAEAAVGHWRYIE